MTKKYFLRTFQQTLLLSFALFNGLPANAAPATVEWSDLQGQFKCKLSSKLKSTKLIPFNTRNRSPGQLVKVLHSPTFNPPLKLTLELTYAGHKPVKVKWDKRFDHVLWNGRDFLLTVQQGKVITGSSRSLITSNTRPFTSLNPWLTLNSGEKIYSSMNFNKLYATYMTGGIKTGTAIFQLYLVKKTSPALKTFSHPGSKLNKNRLLPICNSVSVQIN